MRPVGDRGSGTVLVLICSLVLGLAGAVSVLLAQATLTRHRAAAAADLAALAGADRALQGSPRACAHAGAVAAAGGAILIRCRLDGLVVAVTVAVPAPGVLRPFGPATARARAGPS